MITRYHTLSCPDCQRQKMVAIPSTTAFHCCRDWDVEVDLQRNGMLTNVGETWKPRHPLAPKSNVDPGGDTFGEFLSAPMEAREELANCVWADVATPFADNH